jgi:hypothetical protein
LHDLCRTVVKEQLSPDDVSAMLANKQLVRSRCEL